MITIESVEEFELKADGIVYDFITAPRRQERQYDVKGIVPPCDLEDMFRETLEANEFELDTQDPAEIDENHLVEIYWYYQSKTDDDDAFTIQINYDLNAGSTSITRTRD